MIRAVWQVWEAVGVKGGSWRNQSVNHAIFARGTTIALMTLIAKLASTGKEMMLARQFGRGDALDAFLIAFLLPQFAISVISGSFTSSLVPALTRSLEKSGREGAGDLAFASEIKAPMAFEGMCSEIDLESLPLFQHYQDIPALRTIFKNTDKLLPGHYLVWNGEGSRVEKKVTEHLSGRANHHCRLWPLLMWEMWRERWLQ
jgi:hypothetical protein